VAKLKYLGMAVTDRNYIHKEIKSRLNLENASYYTVLNLLSTCLLSKNLKIKIYKTIVLLIFYGCETCSVTLRVFKNRALKRIFQLKWEEVTEG
jgi:hypothetical protein